MENTEIDDFDTKTPQIDAQSVQKVTRISEETPQAIRKPKPRVLDQKLVIETQVVDRTNVNNFMNIIPDPDDPTSRCVLDLFAESGKGFKIFKKVALGLPEGHLGMGEIEARTKFAPSKYVEIFRSNFWYEYDRAFTLNRKADFERVWGGYTSYEWVKKNMSNGNVAYILTPPVTLKRNLQHLMDKATAKLEEILDMDVYKQDGTPNTPVMNAIMKVYSKLENRVLGPQTMKIEQTNKHLIATADIGAHQISQAGIDKLKAEIEQNNKNLGDVDGEVIEVRETKATK